MAVNFNGTSDLVNMGTLAPLNVATNSAFSLMAWVNFATLAPAANEGIVGKGFDGTNTAYFIQVDSTAPGLQLGTFRGGAVHGFNFYPFSGSPITATNVWYHIYLEYNLSATTWSFYINGVLVGGPVTDALGPISTVDRFVVGATDVNGTFGTFFSGCIADAALFSGPLTTTEISQLAAGTIRPNTGMSKTLWGYWALNTAVGTQPDGSGNGNTGASTGTTTCASSPPFGGIAMMPASLRLT